MEWISNHGTFLQFMTSLGTLAVWIFYAQLLYAGFRRQRRPKVVINQVMGLSTQGRCLISNMSAEGIHIETVQVWLHEKCGVRRCTVSEVESDENGERPTSIAKGTLQGPLPSNAHLDAGEIDSLVRRHAPPISKMQTTPCVTMTIATTCSSCWCCTSTAPLPASWGPAAPLCSTMTARARPHHLETKQLRGYRDRKRMARIYRSYLDR